ncbi:MAG: hypothetical protein QW171_01420 [Candidatus Bilamarchaeaceae archaeon]
MDKMVLPGTTKRRCYKGAVPEEAKKLPKEILDRYKELLDRCPSKLAVKLAVKNGRLLLSGFSELDILKKPVKQKPHEEIRQKVKMCAIDSLDILERLIRCNQKAHIIDSYVENIESIVKIKTKVNIPPALSASLETINGFELKNKEEMEIKLWILTNSIDRINSMISQLDRYGIYEKEGNVVRVHTAREGLIKKYISRPLAALGGDYSYKKANTILRLFDTIDGVISEAMERGARTPAISSILVNDLIEASNKVAELLGEKKYEEAIKIIEEKFQIKTKKDEKGERNHSKRKICSESAKIIKLPSTREESRLL